MARSRNIKPSIMNNEELAELEPMARLLFIYLWMLADREGRLEDRPKRIAAQALPYDRSVDVDATLWKLHQAGFICRYEAEEIACIQILAFSKHQTPHVRESASILPRMVAGTTKAVPSTVQGSDEASPRSPDSLIPDSLIPDIPAPQDGASAPVPIAVRKPKKAELVPLPEGFGISDRVREWADENGHRHLAKRLEHFIGYAKRSGKRYADWDMALMCAIREDWAKLSNHPQQGAAPVSVVREWAV